MSKKVAQWKDRVVGFERRPAKDFQAHSLNFRRHPNNQRDAFRGLVSEIGFAGAVLENITTGNLIDGHLRIEEALSVDENQLIPTVQVELSESEEKLLLASYDPIGAMAVADKDVLDKLLHEVSTGDAAVSQMLSELAEDNGLYFGEKKEEDESTVPELIDRAAELQEKWQVKRGNLYSIGPHRLLCGDSTDAGDVSRLMVRETASLCVTSPPYNVGKNAVLSPHQPNGSKYTNDMDDRESNEYLQFLIKFTELSLTAARFVFVNIQSLANNKLVLVDYLNAQRDRYADTLVWDKMNAQPAMARRVLNSRFEYVHCFSEGANRALGTKDFRGTLDNVIQLPSHQDKDFANAHSATFPVEFARFFLENFCNVGESVYEPFNGSGSTMVAAEQTSRICYGMEIEPKYCAVTLERMFQLTGELPKLVSDSD